MKPEVITAGTLSRLKREAESAGRVVYVWDTKLRGFGLKATPTGTLSFVVQKWVGGRGGEAKRIVIGRNPPMELLQARREAGSIIGDVAKGIDIVDRKEKLRQAKREALTAIRFKDAWDLYVARKGNDGSHWQWSKAKVEGGVFQALGATTALRDITKAEIVSLIDKIENDHPVSARYTFAVLRPFFKWCVGKQYLPVSPMDGLASPSVPKSRDRILSDDELRSFWKAAGDMSLWGPFYRLLLLTAQRREEVAGMEWREIVGSAWTIPGSRTKNGKEHTVHLSPQAMAVLNSIPRLQGTVFVFTTTLVAPISGYGRAKARLDTLSGIKDWVVHDVRRTAASGMAKLGFLPHIIERVLNHVSGAQGGLVAVYQRYEYLEERKRAIEAWGVYVESLIMGAQMTANVVRMPLKSA